MKSKREKIKLWVYGEEKDFFIYKEDVDLDNRCHDEVVHPKGSIVLHNTGANNSARTTIGTWNSQADLDTDPKFSSAHFVLERAEDRIDVNHPYSDVVQIVDNLEWKTNHAGAGGVNDRSIGVEVANRGQVYTRPGDVPDDIDNYLFYHLAQWTPRPPHSNCGPWWYQVLQEEQYKAIILLLRYLCIELSIPSVFLGRDAANNLKKYYPLPANIRNFRGIWAHCNSANMKTCGGPHFFRNRIYRGITDEWWLPVELSAEERGYYTGPFASGRNLRTWKNNEEVSTPPIDADIKALQNTQSYFNFESEENYYSHQENGGGYFPVGLNRCWHGGIHLVPNTSNTRVFAAASGKMVAARMGINPAVEDDIGSPRFVLIKHAVSDSELIDRTFTESQGPDGIRTLKYRVNPKIVFSLYMHLAIMNEPNTPEWFRIWKENNPNADLSSVLNPNVEIMVGDHLGNCGKWYSQDPCLHFEIFSNVLVHVPSFGERVIMASGDSYVPETNLSNDLVSTRDNSLRQCAYRHVSEWALTDAQVGNVIQRPGMANLWPKLKQHFLWYENVRNFPGLSDHLPADGKLYFYHPIFFIRVHNNHLKTIIPDTDNFAGGAPPTPESAQSQSAQGTPSSYNLSRRSDEDVRHDSISCPPFLFSV